MLEHAKQLATPILEDMGSTQSSMENPFREGTEGLPDAPDASMRGHKSILPSKRAEIGKDITYENVFILVNQVRVDEGLKPLRHSATLDKVAQDHLEDMHKDGYFAHKGPSGRDEWYYFNKEDYLFYRGGENLARYFPTVQDLVAGWVASPTHYQNIIDPTFIETGIATDGNIVVEEFGITQEDHK